MHTHSQKIGGPRSTSEATLFRQAQVGCQDSLNALMARHDGLDGRAPAIYRQIGSTLRISANELANFTPRPSSGCATQPTPRLYALSWAATPSPTISLLMTWRSAGSSGEEGDVAANLTAVESRAQHATFVAQCSLPGLQDRLPLRWIVPPDAPPSPKRPYRSHYVYLGGWQDLQDATAWKHLSPFDMILRLVDFTPLRPVTGSPLLVRISPTEKPSSSTRSNTSKSPLSVSTSCWSSLCSS